MTEFKPFLLATYGTLKKGFGNHIIIEHCKLLGECETSPDYTMYSIHWFPGVVNGGTTKIKLEVYKIEDAETARRLDILEGYPDLYDKQLVDTEFGEALIYIYNRNIDNLLEIKSGNWE